MNDEIESTGSPDDGPITYAGSGMRAFIHTHELIDGVEFFVVTEFDESGHLAYKQMTRADLVSG